MIRFSQETIVRRWSDGREELVKELPPRGDDAIAPRQ